MIAAGRPDLVFDLETFTAGMPRHWHERRGDTPVRVFTVGQLVHLRGWLTRLERRVKGPVWPEYAELDCFSCHHDLAAYASGVPQRPDGPSAILRRFSPQPDDSWRQEQGYAARQPGNPALNLSRWMTAKLLLGELDPESATALGPIMDSLAVEASRLKPNGDQVA